MPLDQATWKHGKGLYWYHHCHEEMFLPHPSVQKLFLAHFLSTASELQCEKAVLYSVPISLHSMLKRHTLKGCNLIVFTIFTTCFNTDSRSGGIFLTTSCSLWIVQCELAFRCNLFYVCSDSLTAHLADYLSLLIPVHPFQFISLLTK